MGQVHCLVLMLVNLPKIDGSFMPAFMGQGIFGRPRRRSAPADPEMGLGGLTHQPFRVLGRAGMAKFGQHDGMMACHVEPRFE